MVLSQGLESFRARCLFGGRFRFVVLPFGHLQPCHSRSCSLPTFAWCPVCHRGLFRFFVRAHLFFMRSPKHWWNSSSGSPGSLSASVASRANLQGDPSLGARPAILVVVLGWRQFGFMLEFAYNAGWCFARQLFRRPLCLPKPLVLKLLKRCRCGTESVQICC